MCVCNAHGQSLAGKPRVREVTTEGWLPQPNLTHLDNAIFPMWTHAIFDADVVGDCKIVDGTAHIHDKTTKDSYRWTLSY